MEGGTPVHRMKKTTQRGRDIRKQIQKTNWFKVPPKSAEDRPQQQQGAGFQGTGGGVRRHQTEPSQQTSKPVAVMFIPRTPEGKLIQTLRQIEQKLGSMNTKGVRLVEEAGQKLAETLCKGDPWEQVHCGRPS